MSGRAQATGMQQELLPPIFSNLKINQNVRNHISVHGNVLP
jgi:hypothetical protein